MKRKSIISTILATTVLFAGYNGTADATTTFKDVKNNHWAYQSIEEVAQKKLVAGYEDGTYRPKGEVTRAELAAFLARAFDSNERASEPFSDVSSNHWAVDAIQEGIALGFIKTSDYPNNKFEPNKAMTRAEIARWLSNGLVASNADYQNAINEMANSSLTLIPIPESFKGGVNKADLPYIGVAMGTGLLGGYDDFTFKPNGKTTRAEVAAILLRYLDAMKKTPEQFVGLNELREVALTGTNMKAISSFKEGQSGRTFTELRNEAYQYKNGIGTTYINRVILVDMRQAGKPKGIYRNLIVGKNGETSRELKKGGYYYGVEHKFIPSKNDIKASSYLFSNNNPGFYTTAGLRDEEANNFGYMRGVDVDFKALKVGQPTYMWFGNQIAPNNYEKYPNVMGISQTINGKHYAFGTN